MSKGRVSITIYQRNKVCFQITLRFFAGCNTVKLFSGDLLNTYWNEHFVIFEENLFKMKDVLLGRKKAPKSQKYLQILKNDSQPQSKLIGSEEISSGNRLNGRLKA